MNAERFKSGRGNKRTLKKAGLKITLPRMRILGVLENSADGHMSADDIYRALMEAGDDTSLGTVYRALSQFEAAGLVVRRSFDNNQARFELNYGVQHDHIICVETNKVIEFHDDALDVIYRRIAESHGYILEDHNLILYVSPKKSGHLKSG